MSCQSRLAEWTAVIRTHLPMLSQPQATVLALWSLGLVLARSCALTAVAVCLAGWCHRQEQTVRQQLRECCYEVEAKRGDHRHALAIEPCFAPLLRWVLSGWQGTQVALALEATTLGTRFTVLTSSVVYRGCAIPVAWTMLLANVPQTWRREWLRLLRQLRPAIPRAWTVIVLADRGLYARWRFCRIVRLGWHPFVRLTRGGTFRPDPQATYRPLLSAVEELVQRLGCNSRHSSQLPSADPPQTTRSRREPSGCQPGGQPGHEGQTGALIPLAVVDVVTPVKPVQRLRCQYPLQRDDPQPQRQQVIEILLLELVVTEYQLHRLLCPVCGAATQAE